ncbi:STAS domain-containing protein [Streptomyces sp. BH055]|uniref:STAS domain-containing protein n=1 Tax=unclassified Streptomyces TaxID=2593676 RepID=UPI003BB518CA
MTGMDATRTPQQRLTLHHVSTEPQHVSLRLAEELDYATVTTLCDTVADLMAHGIRHLLVDLSEITWCDSASLYTLLGIHSALQHADDSLALTTPSSATRRGLDCLAPPASHFPTGPPSGTDRRPTSLRNCFQSSRFPTSRLGAGPSPRGSVPGQNLVRWRRFGAGSVVVCAQDAFGGGVSNVWVWLRVAAVLDSAARAPRERERRALWLALQ